MNMIASVQKLDKEDIETIQNFVKTLEEENKWLCKRNKRLNNALNEVIERNSKAIEYISNTLCDDKARVKKNISGKEIDTLVHILKGSDKEWKDI